MTIDVTSNFVCYPKGIKDLLHVDMRNIGADGQVRRRLAPVFEDDRCLCGAAGQVTTGVRVR